MAFIGLRNIVAVKLEKDDVDGTTYASEIKKLKGARLASMDPQLAEGSLHGDDQLLEDESSVSAVDVGIELASLTLEEEAFFTGQKFENGVMIEDKDAQASDIALGFMAPKSKTGGGGFRLIWLTKGSVKPFAEEYETKKDNIEYKTPTLDFTFTPRLSDGVFRIKADTNEENAPTVEEFFTTNYLVGKNIPETED